MSMVNYREIFQVYNNHDNIFKRVWNYKTYSEVQIHAYLEYKIFEKTFGCTITY